MKKSLLVILLVLLTGCSLDLNEVRTREASCRAEGGQVKRVVRNDIVISIRCVVDGAEYWVAPSGKLK